MKPIDLSHRLSRIRQLLGTSRVRWASGPEQLDHIDNLSPMGRPRRVEPERYEPRHRRTR